MFDNTVYVNFTNDVLDLWMWERLRSGRIGFCSGDFDTVMSTAGSSALADYPWHLAFEGNEFTIWACNGPAPCFNSVFEAKATIPGQVKNVWHHYAYVSSASGNKLYIDGVPRAVNYLHGSSADSYFFSDFSPGVSRYQIGQTVLYEMEGLAGSLDDFRIYDYALSDAEIWNYITERLKDALTVMEMDLT
jgi:hypothetical protein